jgi:3-mercaptopyruvate sulfurtransferase SseA
VWILDGGLPKWKELEFPVISGEPAGSYEVLSIGEPRPWEPHPELLASFEEVRAFSKSGDRGTQLVDTRPIPWWVKIFGCYMIKRSKVLAFSNLVNKDKTIKSPQDLLATLRKAGASPDPNIRTISTCQCGVLACNLIAAMAHCENFNTALFDGSYVEYRARS